MSKLLAGLKKQRRDEVMGKRGVGRARLKDTSITSTCIRQFTSSHKASHVSRTNRCIHKRIKEHQRGYTNPVAPIGSNQSSVDWELQKQQL